jgi:hypothetical protein
MMILITMFLPWWHDQGVIIRSTGTGRSQPVNS